MGERNLTKIAKNSNARVKRPFIDATVLVGHFGPNDARRLVDIYRKTKVPEVKDHIQDIYEKINAGEFMPEDAWRAEGILYDMNRNSRDFSKRCYENRFSRACL